MALRLPRHSLRLEAQAVSCPFVLHDLAIGNTTLSLTQFCMDNGRVTMNPTAEGMKIDSDFILKLDELLKGDC